ncbi:CCA tRNA nucleotidyltransferase [Candidatus Dependentiae bacterium]|nr:CCA tRNA nucleotidyltransferase [Candidatus Dependentiae bacterium]
MIQVHEKVQTCLAQIIQQNPLLKSIFQKIKQEKGTVLLVGGAVRDCFLQQADADLDFEVYHLSFEQLQVILSQFGPVSFVGKSFGVLRLLTLDADWSIPRKDSSGRKPIVDLVPDMSFKDAFRRRDLTINAMGINVATLELIDPYDGLFDLQKKILRAPDIDFFKQDPLRLFRVMQFVARFEMQPDSLLNAVCRTMNVFSLSIERIDQEFKKLLLRSNNPSLGLLWLHKIGRFEELFPELSFQKLPLEAFDCLAKKNIAHELKLSAMWSFFALAVKQDLFQVIDKNQLVDKKNLKLVQEIIKKRVCSFTTVEQAAMIAWYLHYIPYLEDQKDYQWLAYWLRNSMSLETFAIIGSCFYDQKMMNRFIDQAKCAGVLQKELPSLVQATDLLDKIHGKQLGKLLKEAYALQINDGINDKKRLLEIILLTFLQDH